MPGTFKTEGVVLRSIRFGEADRVLHLYSSTRGRIGAIAKGSRRPRSRFGGRLEPFFRLNLVLHEGRGELATVTSAATVDGHPRLRESGAALDAGGRACDAVLRLFDAAEANPAAYNLLCRYLALLDGQGSIANPAGDPAARAREPSARVTARPPGSLAEHAAGLALALAFRLKLTLAAGFVPELASCARCGEVDGLIAFSGAAGGMVCAACEGGGFELSAVAHRFMVDALGSPLTAVPPAGERALRQVERAISETLEHHAHVRLRAAA